MENWSQKEAPMLSEMVKAGKLPPLAERLPDEPLVVESKEIGRYGGTLVKGTAFLRSEWIPTTLAMEGLMHVTWPLPADGPLLPNVARDWTFNDDGTELTVKLRKGMKWSDGMPFTADDILFYWEDILLDDKVTTSPPSVLKVGGKLPTLAVIDDVTLKYSFPKPFFFAETALATLYEIAWPKHVMSKLHPKYNSAATYEDLNKNLNYFTGRGRVTLGAWVLENYFPGEKFALVRNPYYWKVDKNGNQLPYFDRVETLEVEDRQGVAMGTVTGEFDVDGMWVGTQHLQLFLKEKQNRKYTLGYSSAAGMSMHFNYDAVDPTVRAAFRDVNFRRAFSLAIDRDEINFVSFNDQLSPRGWAWSPLSTTYDEADANLWIKHDLKQANNLLDAGGYADNNGDGFREAPDGSPLQVIVDVSIHDLYVPINEMIRDQLAKAGIKIVLNVQHQDLIEARRLGQEWQMFVWDFMATEEPLTALQVWVPVNDNTPFWHQKSSKAPFSAEFKQYSDLLLGAASLPSKKRDAAIREAGKIMADNVFGIFIGDYERPYIKSDRIANLPERYARIDEFGGNMTAFRYHQTFGRWDK